MGQLSSHQRGLLMTVCGVLVLTPDALLLRLVEADHWTIMFWRSLFAAVSFFVINAFVEKESPIKSIRGVMKGGILCAFFFAGSNICFVTAITHTATANALVILASVPFIAAMLTVLLIRKKIPLRVWIIIVFCIAGVVIVFWGRFGDGSIYGDFFAFLTALFVAGIFTVVNKNPGINTLASIGLGSILAAGFAFYMGSSLAAVTHTDFIYIALNGAVVFPVAFGLITFGPKLISPPEVGIIMLLETVLGPLWVWMVLNEVPSHQTFFGGAIVIAAVIINAVMGFRAVKSGTDHSFRPQSLH